MKKLSERGGQCLALLGERHAYPCGLGRLFAVQKRALWGAEEGEGSRRLHERPSGSPPGVSRLAKGESEGWCRWRLLDFSCMDGPSSAFVEATSGSYAEEVKQQDSQRVMLAAPVCRGVGKC